jgi:four helix bundle protein
MHDFRRLKVWDEARRLGTEIYELCARRPRAELLITAQLRRSALSIATNIAEGCGKSSRAETIRYLEIAAGSAAETEHHLEVARDLRVLTSEQAEDLIARVRRLRRSLSALIDRFPK